MALNGDAWKAALKPVLVSGLKDIYAQMHDEDVTKDDDWFAEQLGELLASAISDTGTTQMKTAGIPSGSVIVSVTGQATGTPNTDEITVE
jgi:hypothetical protein